MDILGKSELDKINIPPVETLVVRKAWELLQSFGNETYDRISSTDPDNNSIDEVYEYIETETEFFDEEDKFSAYLDQLPFINGELSTAVGFVALHIDAKDEWDDVIQTQQIVFRLETHDLGPAVFEGDPFELEQVNDVEDLFDILSFLQNLSVAMWKQFNEKDESKMMTMPISEYNRKFNALMTRTLFED